MCRPGHRYSTIIPNFKWYFDIHFAFNLHTKVVGLSLIVWNKDYHSTEENNDTKFNLYSPKPKITVHLSHHMSCCPISNYCSSVSWCLAEYIIMTPNHLTSNLDRKHFGFYTIYGNIVDKVKAVCWLYEITLLFTCHTIDKLTIVMSFWNLIDHPFISKG